MTASTLAPPEKSTKQEVDWDKIEALCLSTMGKYAEKKGLTMESRPTEHDSAAFRIAISGFTYPDKVGTGTLYVWGDTLAGRARLRMEMDHNRVFSGGTSRVFLNDYKFGRRISEGPGISEGVLREALKDVDATLTAVERVKARSREGGANVVHMSLRISSR